MKGAEIVARALKAEGVEFITAFPHSEVIDGCAAVGIRPILARTERVAVNIADGFARATNGRRVSACTFQYGPGAENAFGAIAQAYADASPVLIVPGVYARPDLGLRPSFQGLENYGRITKWTGQANSVERIGELMLRAVTQLKNGKPGPVVVEIPDDLMNAELPGRAFKYASPKASRPQADPGEVKETVAALLAARNPVIYAGQGIFYAEAWDELKAFAELVQVPVATTLAGKSCFPEDHPLALGTGGMSRTAMVEEFFGRADFVLGIGTSFTRSHYTTPPPAKATLAQITNAPEDVNTCFPVSYGAIGDAKAVLKQMTAEARRRLGAGGRRGAKGVAKRVVASKAAFLKAWMPRLTSDEAPISPYRVVWDLMHTVDRRRTMVTHDAGNPRDQVIPFYEAIVPRGYIGWGKSTQLGTGLGLSMGTKLAHPDWLTVNIMGDWAFGMVGMDFETSLRANIPILTVILNNSVMGGYLKHMPVARTRYKVDSTMVDHARLAEVFGGYGERVVKPADLKPAFRRAIAEVKKGRSAMIEVITKEEPSFAPGKPGR